MSQLTSQLTGRPVLEALIKAVNSMRPPCLGFPGPHHPRQTLRRGASRRGLDRPMHTSLRGTSEVPCNEWSVECRAVGVGGV